MTANPPAVILGGHANAVSVARSLNTAGATVYAVGDGTSPVRHSRACAGFWDLGGGSDVQGRWLEWLEHGPRGAVLLPCNDDGLELVARNRSVLLDLGYIPVEANDDVLLAMLDKDQTYALAAKAGIGVPRTVTLTGRRDLEDAAHTIGFPSALKPRDSHVFQRRAGMSVKVVVVRDAAELRANFERLDRLGLRMILTEIIPGPDDAYSSYYGYLDEDARPLLHFTKRKIRQYPIGFGLICYQVTEWDDDVARLGLQFFQGAGVKGLANVEFKRDVRDGGLKLIECNHRFTAANEIVRIAGIDLALFTYNRLIGRTGPRVDTYRTGVRMWHPIEDVRALREYRRRDGLSFRAWTTSLLHRQHFPMFRWSDPNPTLAELFRKFRKLPTMRVARRGPASPEPARRRA